MNKTTQSPRPLCKAGAMGLCLLTLLVLCAALPAAEPVVRDLYSTEYFPAVHEEFQKAKESIVVAMYQIRLYPYNTSDSPTFTLVRDLIDARKRGVKVTVILNNAYRQHPTKVKGIHDSAVQMLASGGIEARYVSVRRVLHEKLIVIDGETVICGSHNWSDAALKHNIESSNLVRSKKYAEMKLKQISKLELLPPEPVPDAPLAVVSVPLSFLTRKDLAQDMMEDSDDRAFDLYLLILRYGSSDISLDHTVTAAELGMNRRSGRTAYRRQISKALRKLQDEYGLIECTFYYGKNTDVKLTALGVGGDERIEVPEGYWEYGLCRKLSLPARGGYLICLAEAEASSAKPWWTASGKDLAAKYPGKRWSIVRGLGELEEMDLLEIVRSTRPPGEPYSHRRPNSYRLKPLLAPDVIEEQWRQLADAYGRDEVRRARAQAGRFDRRNNRTVAAELIMLADTYGWKLTEKAVGEVAKMVPDNPARHVGYITIVLKCPSRKIDPAMKREKTDKTVNAGGRKSETK